MRRSPQKASRSLGRLTQPLCQARFYGVDGRLGPCRHIELAEDAADVVLDGLLAQKKLLRDLFVREPNRNQLNDVCFAFRQLRWIALVPALAHATQHAAGEAWVYIEVAPVDGEQCAREIRKADVLDDVTFESEHETALEQR